MEDVLLAQHYSTARALKPRDVLEYTCPEINFDTLKCAPLSETVQKQLMKVDEQNVSQIFEDFTLTHDFKCCSARCVNN